MPVSAGQPSATVLWVIVDGPSDPPPTANQRQAAIPSAPGGRPPPSSRQRHSRSLHAAPRFHASCRTTLHERTMPHHASCPTCLMEGSPSTIRNGGWKGAKVHRASRLDGRMGRMGQMASHRHPDRGRSTSSGRGRRCTAHHETPPSVSRLCKGGELGWERSFDTPPDGDIPRLAQQTPA